VVGPAEASLVVAERVIEALISDKLAGELGVVILFSIVPMWIAIVD
jgi:hypothetical protein